MERPRTVLRTLTQADPQFTELVSKLYGGLVDADALYQDVYKASPDPSDVNSGGSTKRNIALGSTVAGAGLAVKEVGEKGRAAFGLAEKAPKVGGRMVPVKALMKNPKVGVGLAAGALGGDLIATDELRPKSRVDKAGLGAMADGITTKLTGMLPDSIKLRNGKAWASAGPNPAATKGAGASVTGPTGKVPGATTGNPSRAVQNGRAVQTLASNTIGTTPGKIAAGAGIGAMALKRRNSGGDQGDQSTYLPPEPSQMYGKSAADVTWEGEFSKLDDDKRLAFGWASVIEVNGVPVVDTQGDLIHPDDLETAAYSYIQKSRKGGHMHRRNELDEPVHVSDIVESVVFTKEKIAKMGLPESTPIGWWIGVKVHDDDVWGEVKKGGLAGFSIHGRGRRREHSMDEAMGYR